MSYFFRPRTLSSPVTPIHWFEKQLANSGLRNKISNEHLTKTQHTAKVFYNKQYLPDNQAVQRALTKIPAVNVEGDRSGYFQNGLEFPSDPHFFANIPEGHPDLLSPLERLAASKKIVYSNSLVFASGGYPVTNPIQPYPKHISAGIFSLAGAAFENDYLHYRLFMLDPKNCKINTKNFEGLFSNLTTDFEEAKRELSVYDLNDSLARIRTGLPYLARTRSGTYYSSFTKTNSVIFLSKAYSRHLLEDTALLLASVNTTAEEIGKPALLKATAVGMGFFAKINGSCEIDYLLYPYFLRAFKKLLEEQSYPWIAKIEFPTFSELQQIQFDSVFENFRNPVAVTQSSRDVLKFTEAETEKYFPCAINPTDAFALTGNEWGFGSVESMMANISSLRFDQVPLVNPLLLDTQNHIPVHIGSDFRAVIEAPTFDELIRKTI